MFEEAISSFYDLIPTDNKVGNAFVIPDDYKGSVQAPFLRLGVVFAPRKHIATNGTKELRGLLKITIFKESGDGPLYFTSVANDLDELFQDKLLPNYLQTYASSLQLLGTDPKDATLSMAVYSVPFSYYGE